MMDHLKHGKPLSIRLSVEGRKACQQAADKLGLSLTKYISIAAYIHALDIIEDKVKEEVDDPR